MANSTDKSILTAAGKALLAQLNAEEKALVIDKMIFANVPNRPEYPQPDDVVPTDHIVHQEQVEQRGRLSADSVIYSTTLTSDVGPFDFNWTGAYCSEYGVLVTIDHHALTPKTADEPGVAGNTLVRSVVLEYKDIAEITNITVDASSWQYNATERMKKMDSDVAQSIIDQNGKDWFIEDGFLVTPSGSAYSIKAGAGYVSGNRVAMEFDRSVQVPNKPSFIYIDAHREGTPTGEQVTLFNFVVTAEEKDDYIDSSTGKDVKHFVCKIAQVHADGSVSDLRPEGESAGKDWVRKLPPRTFGTDWVVNSISDLARLKAIDGDKAKVISYHAGSFAQNKEPVGGGNFEFVLTSTPLDDGVKHFAVSGGHWVRIGVNKKIKATQAGMNEILDDNAEYLSKLVAYCRENKCKLVFDGYFKSSIGLDTEGIPEVSGYMRDNDGLKIINQAGKTAINWKRPTVIKDFKIVGSDTKLYIDDGSMGIDGAPYLNRGERIRVHGFGKGHRWFNSVDCHCKHFWFINNYRAVELNGFLDNSQFSTTGSYSDTEFHGNFDGVVVGKYGAFNTAFIGFNLHNCIFEKNTNNGLVCANEEIDGVLYESLVLRQLTVTGFIWFENNGGYAYALPRCLGVTWLCSPRIESGQKIIEAPIGRSTVHDHGGVKIGKRLTVDYKGFTSGDGAYYSNGAHKVGFMHYLDEAREVLDGGISLQQALDFSVVGSCSQLKFYTKSEHEDEASVKATLDRNGNWIPVGSTGQFTGVHRYYSETYIASGLAVDLVNADKRSADGILLQGEIAISHKADSKVCVGVVDSLEDLSTGGFCVLVAAVGDNATNNIDGFFVDGDFEPGDRLSTSGTPGHLKRYEGTDNRVMTFKGLYRRESGLVYGYF
ncbi:TPA: phage tail protein [Vibrio alginolyticus]